MIQEQLKELSTDQTFMDTQALAEIVEKLYQPVCRSQQVSDLTMTWKRAAELARPIGSLSNTSM